MEKLQILGHPWAVTTKMEIWLGDVAKGQEVDVNKVMMMFEMRTTQICTYFLHGMTYITIQKLYLIKN